MRIQDATATHSQLKTQYPLQQKTATAKSSEVKAAVQNEVKPRPKTEELKINPEIAKAVAKEVQEAVRHHPGLAVKTQGGLLSAKGLGVA